MRTFFGSLLGSFYSPAPYMRARYAAQGWGMVYALGVVAITTLICVLWFALLFHRTIMQGEEGRPSLFESSVAQIQAQWPEMKIEQNTATVYAAQPRVINLEGAIAHYPFKFDFITIDTSGKTTAQTMKTPVLITADSVVTTKDSGKRKEIQPLSEIVPAQKQPLLLDRAKIDETARELLDTVHHSMWMFYLVVLPTLWGVMTGAYFLGRAILLLAVGGIGFMLGNMGAAKITYMQSMRLAALAYTPVAFVGLGVFLLTYNPLSTLLSLALGVFMLFIALSVTKPEVA